MFAMQGVSSKGKGLIATRPIVAGELILTEAPLFTLSRGSNNADVVAALRETKEREQRSFFSLTNCHRLPILPPLDIFKTNVLPCGENSVEAGTYADRGGLFITGSRFNSSCLPNVHNFWDEGLQKISFRAVRDILPGEELCICYVGLYSKCQDRQTKLKSVFGSKCTCQACTLPEEEQKRSDERRTTASRLYHEIAACGSQPTLGLSKVKLLIQLLEEEGIMAYTGAIYYYDGFQFCASSSDVTNAKAWVAKALEAECRVRGDSTPSANKYVRYLRNPRKHPAFGLCPKQILSGPDD